MSASSRPLALKALIAVVSLVGVAVLVGAILGWRDEDELILIVLAALTVATELFDFSPFPNSRVSLSIAFIFAAGTITGLPGVAVVASTAAAADYAAHRKPLVKAVFNEGAMLTSGASYVGVLEVFSSTHDPSDWMAMLGPAVLGCVVAFALNSLLVTLAISLDTGRNPVRIWDSSFRWLFPHYVVLASLALLLAIAYDRWDLSGLALLLLPMSMAWLIVKQYTDRVRQPAAPL